MKANDDGIQKGGPYLVSGDIDLIEANTIRKNNH